MSDGSQAHDSRKPKEIVLSVGRRRPQERAVAFCQSNLNDQGFKTGERQFLGFVVPVCRERGKTGIQYWVRLAIEKYGQTSVYWIPAFRCVSAGMTIKAGTDLALVSCDEGQALAWTTTSPLTSLPKTSA